MLHNRQFPVPISPNSPFPLKEGVKVLHITLSAGQTYKFEISTPNLMNLTIRIANSTQLSENTTLKVYFHNYKTMNAIYYTLTPNRYGVFIDNKPLDYIIFENLDEELTLDVYMEYLIKNYHEPFQEEVQFITVIQELPPPPSTQLFQGTNQRYNGTLADATFLESVPLDTYMAVRQINSVSTSIEDIGIVEIPLAGNMTYHANLAPGSYIQYGQNSTSEIVVFTADSVTQQLPSSATQSYATTNQIVIDYSFDYNLSVSFASGYTITTSGTTTTITFSGDANAYYYSNTSLPLSNASLSLSESESQYTLSPNSGTTNSSGQVPFTFSETLDSTTTLPANEITVSADVAGISKSGNATFTPSFNFTLSQSVTQLISVSNIVLDTATAGGMNTNPVNLSVTTQNENDIIFIISNDMTTGVSISPSLTINTRYNASGLQYYYAVASTVGTYTISYGNRNNEVIDATAIVLSAKYIDYSNIFYNSSTYAVDSSSSPVNNIINLVGVTMLFTIGSTGNGNSLSLINSSESGITSVEQVNGDDEPYELVTDGLIVYSSQSNVNCGYTYAGSYADVFADLIIINAEAATLTYTLTASNGSILPNQTISITATNGTPSSDSLTTNSSGQASVNFTQTSPNSSITASSEVATITKSVTTSF